MSKIIFNGKETEFNAGDNLKSFLRERQIEVGNLILEWNGTILTGNDPLETFALKDGDTLNLYSMVGGG